MSIGTWQGGALAWTLYLLGTTVAMAVALVWGRGSWTRRDGDGMDVEIARYPIRCHRCGRTEQVRVFAVAAYDPSVMCRNELLTRREAPEGWTWERSEDGQPLWVCPECSGGGAE